MISSLRDGVPRRASKRLTPGFHRLLTPPKPLHSLTSRNVGKSSPQASLLPSPPPYAQDCPQLFPFRPTCHENICPSRWVCPCPATHRPRLAPPEIQRANSAPLEETQSKTPATDCRLPSSPTPPLPGARSRHRSALLRSRGDCRSTLPPWRVLGKISPRSLLRIPPSPPRNRSRPETPPRKGSYAIHPGCLLLPRRSLLPNRCADLVCFR